MTFILTFLLKKESKHLLSFREKKVGKENLYKTKFKGEMIFIALNFVYVMFVLLGKRK